MATLPFLVTVILRKNQISSLNSLNRKPAEGAEGEDITFWPKLQTCDLSSNKIDKITPIGCPALVNLDLSSNQISSIQDGDDGFQGHETLEVLDISGNAITNLAPLTGVKKLRVLYATANKIFKFSGMEGCEELEIINLRGNSVLYS